MLFRDQCVHIFNVDSYIEDEESITSIGYRVKVDSEYVTEMRVFRNVGAVTAKVNCENLIEFNKNLFFGFLNNVSQAVYEVPNALKTVEVEVYEVVFSKENGSSTENNIGGVTMSDVINGKFGNYFPASMINQASVSYIPLTNKFISGKKYYISHNTYDCLTIFALEDVVVKLIVGNTENAETLGKGFVYIISLNSAAWGLTDTNYTIEVGSNFSIEIEKSAYIDNLPQRRGVCYVDAGEIKHLLYVHHPWGGLDNIGTVNMVGGSGSTSRQSVRLQDTTYIHGGSANEFHVTTQLPSDFSVHPLTLKSEGTFSCSYESYITNVNELWIAAMAASRSGYIVTTGDVQTIVEVEINSISFSPEELSDGMRVWKLSISCTQKVPFVA